MQRNLKEIEAFWTILRVCWWTNSHNMLPFFYMLLVGISHYHLDFLKSACIWIDVQANLLSFFLHAKKHTHTCKHIWNIWTRLALLLIVSYILRLGCQQTVDEYNSLQCNITFINLTIWSKATYIRYRSNLCGFELWKQSKPTHTQRNHANSAGQGPSWFWTQDLLVVRWQWVHLHARQNSTVHTEIFSNAKYIIINKQFYGWFIQNKMGIQSRAKVRYLWTLNPNLFLLVYTTTHILSSNATPLSACLRAHWSYKFSLGSKTKLTPCTKTKKTFFPGELLIKHFPPQPFALIPEC